MSTPKPPQIIDRDAEWEALDSLWRSRRPELGFVVGRRRIGKSFLLARFAAAAGGLYYQATRRTEREQLQQLSREAGRHFSDDGLELGSGFSDWEGFFRYLLRKADGGPFLLVLDEFPYLAEAAGALPSVLQSLWDHDFQESRVKIILAGSYITAMTRLEEADQPLYGRRTARIPFGPFGLPEAAEFVPDWSVRDQMLMYGTYGNLPGHLNLADPDLQLSANLERDLLSPSGRLTDDAQFTLDAFLGESGVHYTILEAVARGARTWKELTNRVGRSGGSLLRPLVWLEDMGLLRRDVPVTERRPEKSRKAVYRLTDPYLLLWNRVIAPLVHAGSIGLVPPPVLWDEYLAPALDDHMGEVFEEVCRDYVARRGRAGELPFQPVRVGSWWDAREQVDIVALGRDGEVLAGEAKWGVVDGRDLQTLRRRARLLQQDVGSAGEPHLMLFSGRGEFDDGVQAASARGEVTLVGPEGLVSG